MRHAAHWNYRTQKLRQNRHLRTIAQVCRAVFLQLRHVSTIKKKNLLNGNISSICFHNMVNFRTLAAEICWRVWAPQQISVGFACWLRYCSNVTQWTSTKLCTMFGHPSPTWVYYIYIYISGGYGPLMEFYQLQNSLCFQVLRSPILAALLHGTRAVGVSQSLRRGTMNGITELLQTALPIFGWAAITLGIGPHSSFLHILQIWSTLRSVHWLVESQ